MAAIRRIIGTTDRSRTEKPKGSVAKQPQTARGRSEMTRVDCGSQWVQLPLRIDRQSSPPQCNIKTPLRVGKLPDELHFHDSPAMKKGLASAASSLASSDTIIASHFLTTR